jgi:heat shock protein HtpX
MQTLQIEILGDTTAEPHETFFVNLSSAEGGILQDGRAIGTILDDDGGGGIIGAVIMMIVAPIAAMLIQMAISRSREYLADATGAQICHHPEALASALKKLEEWNQRVPMEVNPATAQMYIVNPLTSGTIANLFSTHPPMQERIRRLLEMRGRA